ncbi:DUF2397 family protein [uncultured Amnibacterium sp.]|uniref:DUF2397 family protein n=1 Tax=uncultured Amnibacterium sp. TaxID=1631851 RepID=UPI0035C987D2
MTRTTYGVFRYLSAENAPLYREVMREFVRAKERFKVALRPEEVVDALDGAHAEAVPAALGQLEQWGNIRSDPDTSRVTTVADFQRVRVMYQFTPEGDRAALEDLRQSARAVRAFTAEYARYATVASGRAAEGPRRAQSAVDAAQRALREAGAMQRQAADRLRAAQAAAAAIEDEVERARAAIDALRDLRASDTYTGLQAARQEADRAAGEADRRRDQVAAVRTAIGAEQAANATRTRTRQAVDDAQAWLAAARAEAAALEDTAARAAKAWVEAARSSLGGAVELRLADRDRPAGGLRARPAERGVSAPPEAAR